MCQTDEERLMWLDALIAAGVDNWDGYDEAINIYQEWLREDAKDRNVQTNA